MELVSTRTREHDITEAALAFQRASHIAPEDFYNGQTTVSYYAACAAGLKMAGYATSKDYHKKLAYIIDTYELWRFDLDLLEALVAYVPVSTSNLLGQQLCAGAEHNQG